MPIIMHPHRMKVKDEIDRQFTIDAVSDLSIQQKIKVISQKIDEKIATITGSIIDTNEITSMLFPIFAPENEYKINDYILHTDPNDNKNKIYRFIFNHESDTEWNDADVIEVNIGKEITNLINKLKQIDTQVVNVFNPQTALPNTCVANSATGKNINTLTSLQNSFLSELIPCKVGDIITIHCNAANSQNYKTIIADTNMTILYNNGQPNGVTNYSTEVTDDKAAFFRFNVQATSKQELYDFYCTINREIVGNAKIPYGLFESVLAQENLCGGIIAQEKTEEDTQEVKIDSTTGKLYTNIHMPVTTNRQLILPKNIYIDNKAYSIPWRSLYWERQLNSTYFNSPQNKIMPQYYVIPASNNNNTFKTNNTTTITPIDAMSDIAISTAQTTVIRRINPKPEFLQGLENEKNLLILGDKMITEGTILKEIKVLLPTNIHLIGNKEYVNSEDSSALKHAGYDKNTYADYIKKPASGHTNPFSGSNTTTLYTDIQNYITNTLGANTLDYVIINLGTNDINANTAASQIINNMTTLINLIHQAYNNAIIIINGVLLPSLQYNTDFNPIERSKQVLELNQAIENQIQILNQDNTTDFVFFAPTHVLFDTQYYYNLTTTPIQFTDNSRNVFDTNTWPNVGGYKLIGKESAWCLLWNIFNQ